MSSILQIKPYIPVPEEIKVPKNQMNKVLNSFAETYGVTWVAGKMHHARLEGEGAIIKRRRIILYCWYKTFFCHRSGEKEPPRACTNDSSKISRPSQKPSKKINCPATMRITCYKKDPDNVIFTFQKQHNHQIGSIEDFCHLPLSKTVKNFIMQKLQQGYDCKEVRRQLNNQIQNSLRAIGDNNQNVFHRDQIIDRNEVYNMYKKLQETGHLNRIDQPELVIDRSRQEEPETIRISTEDFALFRANFEEALNNNDMGDDGDEEAKRDIEETTSSLDNAAEIMSNMWEIYRTYKENPGHINDEELSILKDATSVIKNILGRNTNVDHLTNM